MLLRWHQLDPSYPLIRLLVVLRPSIGHKPFGKRNTLSSLLVDKDHTLINLAFKLVLPIRMNISVEIVSSFPHLPVPDKLKTHNLGDAVEYPIPID